MSTIEQASKRLEELRKAGVDMPWVRDGDAVPLSPAQPAALVGGLQEAPAQGARLQQHLPEPKQKVTINLQALQDMQYIVPGAPRSRLLDEFRGVKRPLLGNAIGGKSRPAVERGNLIMVTSSLPGEGKTFTAINLAMSMAMEMNSSVLLVDADPSRMAAAERLGLHRGRGLMDLLLDPKLELADVELGTNVEKLSFLHAGTSDERATEIFSSDAMSRFLNTLASHRQDRIVVFDAPPLLPSAEARALAPQMGQVVLVVQAGKTHQGTVQQSMAMLDDCPVVMSLLNQSRAPSSASPYGYYAY